MCVCVCAPAPAHTHAHTTRYTGVHACTSYGNTLCKQAQSERHTQFVTPPPPYLPPPSPPLTHRRMQELMQATFVDAPLEPSIGSQVGKRYTVHATHGVSISMLITAVRGVARTIITQTIASIESLFHSHSHSPRHAHSHARSQRHLSRSATQTIPRFVMASSNIIATVCVNT